jgi:hypothetical protein
MEEERAQRDVHHLFVGTISSYRHVPFISLSTSFCFAPITFPLCRGQAVAEEKGEKDEGGLFSGGFWHDQTPRAHHIANMTYHIAWRDGLWHFGFAVASRIHRRHGSRTV